MAQHNLLLPLHVNFDKALSSLMIIGYYAWGACLATTPHRNRGNVINQSATDWTVWGTYIVLNNWVRVVLELEHSFQVYVLKQYSVCLS